MTKTQKFYQAVNNHNRLNRKRSKDIRRWRYWWNVCGKFLRGGLPDYCYDELPF